MSRAVIDIENTLARRAVLVLVALPVVVFYMVFYATKEAVSVAREAPSAIVDTWRGRPRV